MVADYGPQCKYARWNMAHSIPQFMKNKPEIEDDDHYLEILKAVAQAWQSHTGSSKPATEFAAHRRNCRNNPSRFKNEAVRKRRPAMELRAVSVGLV